MLLGALHKDVAGAVSLHSCTLPIAQNLVNSLLCGFLTLAIPTSENATWEEALVF